MDAYIFISIHDNVAIQIKEQLHFDKQPNYPVLGSHLSGINQSN
jgi:hypothetical protein